MINLVNAYELNSSQWELKRTVFDPSKAAVEESLFTLANGYLGVRGCFEEGYGDTVTDSVRGAYINGLYDRKPIIYGEAAYGYPTLQDIQPKLIDTQTCEIYLDGEQVLLSNQQHSAYERTLDFRNGQSLRTYNYRTQNGKVAQLSFKRLASLWHQQVFVYQIEVIYEGLIEMKSSVDTHVVNEGNPGDPRLSQVSEKRWETRQLTVESNRVFALVETENTGIFQSTIVDYRFPLLEENERTNLPVLTHEKEAEKVITTVRGRGKLVLEKHSYMTDSLRHRDVIQAVHELANEDSHLRYQDYLHHQRDYLDDYWTRSDITIATHEVTDLQSTIRFIRFQMLQSVGVDTFSNVSAKGLSGEGYGGHYFWDTEIYVLPLLLMTDADRAENLLAYRHRILPYARSRAIELGFEKGAVYPWRTISGIECSAYFPAGTAQYHINSDIAYAFIQSYLYSQNLDFLIDMGAEVILETARIWLEMGHYDQGYFKINTVTGPDEYTAIVNNNYYTNAMAKYHLEWAAKIYKILTDIQQEKMQKRVNQLLKKIDFSEAEASQMRLASEKMFLPHDDEKGIDVQDDTFLSKPKWPFDKVDPLKSPLLLYYHPLTIYRYQVLKQADTVLAHYLLEDYTDEETMKRSLAYYEAITTHDSSLSTCIYGIMASRCGVPQKAYHYFMESLYLDLKDTHHNTKDGLHMANLAGSCHAIINGFAGYRIKESGISFRPTLPEAWDHYRFKIYYQKRWIEIYIGEKIILSLLEGEPLKVNVYGQSYYLKDQLFLTLQQERSYHEDNQRYYF